ncbi:MAG TPA: type II toxin-antitoxin system PemK/MazF family toxin [Chitinophagaceae bacterium]|nr:type II toxin-antitoxin system PemK/MazF family toxin [Chitinophagaceae bacterium]
MPYDQGDIVLVTFPYTDLSTTKVRPAIVVSNSDINNTDDVILAAITTDIKNDEFSFGLDNSYLTKSMTRPSEVRCHKLFTCDQNIIQKAISKLNRPHLDNLTKAVKQCFSMI